MHEPKQPGTLPPLPFGELHVWRISLPDPETNPEPYTRLLAEEEADLADRLRAGQVRLQFVIARAALRTLLGSLLTLDPAQVPLETGAQGKPAVPGIPLHFNLAHTGEIILIALCRNCEVGIDVEHNSREVEALDIARSSFSAREIDALENILNADELQRAFFRCWTRKEAIIKADGRGLSLPLASFNVPVTGDASATPIEVPCPEAVGTRTFYLTDLPCGEELAAAFAIDSPLLRLRQFDFPLGLLLQSRVSSGPPG